MDSLQAECAAKRRRVAIGNEEHNDTVKIKDRKDSEQRLNHKNPFGANVGVVDVGDLWLKVKKEIKEELERDLRSSNFDDFDHTFWKEVEVKDEMENDEEDHDKSLQKPEVAVKQEVGQRLTGKVQATPGSVEIKKEKVAEPIGPLADADGHEDGHAHLHEMHLTCQQHLGFAIIRKIQLGNTA